VCVPPARTPIRVGGFLNGLLDKIMKTILSLVLPINATWRYIRKGRKAIGFKAGTLVTRSATGTEVGVSDLAAGEVAMAAGDAKVISKRLTVFSGRTAATAATIPAASGELRELIIMNANTSSGAVTITAPTTSIYDAGSASASATDVIAIGDTAHYLSNGASWFRITKP
jgi:hypothetical protein